MMFSLALFLHEIMVLCLPSFLIYSLKMQVLSDFDVFSIDGANKPLQLVDARVSIKEEGPLIIRFEGISGSPVVSGICIRKASNSGLLCFFFQHCFI